MHGPTCVFWANLTPFSLQWSRPNTSSHAISDAGLGSLHAVALAKQAQADDYSNYRLADL